MNSAAEAESQDRPDVTIIMSVFNDAPWLQTTLAAMFAQTHRDFELLIIDDGSTDNTPEILKRFSDNRLRWIRHDARMGWLASMNKLATIAGGQLLKFHCPDDVLEPSALERAVAFYRRHPDVGYIFCDYYVIDENGIRLAERPVRAFTEVIQRHVADELALHDGCFANTSCLFVPREKFLAAGGMRDVTRHNPERWPTVEDYELMVRLQQNNDVGYIPAQLVAVRAHPMQVQANNSAQLLSLEGVLFIQRELAGRMIAAAPHEARRIKDGKTDKIARDHFHHVIRQALRGERRHAWNMLGILRHDESLSRLLVAWLKTSALPALERRFWRLALRARPSR